jgi:hypothetical protein
MNEWPDTRSTPREHYELHVRWHLASHRNTGNSVFVLMDRDSRGVHPVKDFEVTFMVVESSECRSCSWCSTDESRREP